MNTLELKNILMHRISEINDIDFLKALKTILDSKADSRVIHLSQEQKDEIIKSRNEVEKGLYVDQDDLDQKFKEK